LDFGFRILSKENILFYDFTLYRLAFCIENPASSIEHQAARNQRPEIPHPATNILQ